MIVEYSNTGFAVADGDAISYASKAWANQLDIKVSSEITILAFRVLVRDGFIKHDELVFLFKGQKIQVDSKGELEKYPNGFCDTFSSLLFRLI